jgi:hypothetical protein
LILGWAREIREADLTATAAPEALREAPGVLVASSSLFRIFLMTF